MSNKDISNIFVKYAWNIRESLNLISDNVVTLVKQEV